MTCSKKLTYTDKAEQISNFLLHQLLVAFYSPIALTALHIQRLVSQRHIGDFPHWSYNQNFLRQIVTLWGYFRKAAGCKKWGVSNVLVN